VVTIPASEQRFDGDAEFSGQSTDDSASIVYYQKKRHIFGDLKFEIYNQKGELVSTLSGDKRKGLNRLPWLMRMKSPKVPAGASVVPNLFAVLGPRVPLGTYSVKMIKGKQTYTSTLQLTPDPRANYSQEDSNLQQQTVMKLYNELARLTFVTESVVDVRDQARKRLAQLAPKSPATKDVQRLADSMEDLRARLVAVKEGGGITGEEKLREKLAELYGSVNGYDGRPSQSQLDYMQTLLGELDQAEADFRKTAAAQLQTVNPALEKQKLEPIRVMTREEWGKKSQ
jgi:hypothetical protein